MSGPNNTTLRSDQSNQHSELVISASTFEPNFTPSDTHVLPASVSSKLLSSLPHKSLATSRLLLHSYLALLASRLGQYRVPLSSQQTLAHLTDQCPYHEEPESLPSQWPPCGVPRLISQHPPNILYLLPSALSKKCIGPAVALAVILV